MGPLMVLMSLVAAFGLSLCSTDPVSDNYAVFVKSPISVQRGHTTTLPCWLSPPQSTGGLEVRWYRPNHFDSPVILYRSRKFVVQSQSASYVGRVSIGLTGLKTGDVSLKLVNATLEDAGEYICYVSSDQGYDNAGVNLTVTAKGTTPLLSAVWRKDNLVNVSCESEGWYSDPSLRWSDNKQVLSPENLKFSYDSSGLRWVHSWLLVSSPTVVTCSVGLSVGEVKEARLRLENPPQSESGSSAAGWVAFALVLTATLAVFGWLYLKNRRRKAKPGSVEENQNLLPKVTGVIQPTDLSTASKHYVNVTLDEARNTFLTIKDGHKVRDPTCDFPDGDKVTCLTAIKGTPGFSSGQHYWEVSLGNTNIGIKQSWWVGVTSTTVISQATDFSPTTSNGYWFLSSSSDREDNFQFSTEPTVLFSVNSRPHTVGVYLNYDGGELSFYDVEKKMLIGSLTGTFTGKVFPFFNPGKGDKAPMEILQRSNEVSVVTCSTAQEAEP